MSIRIIELIQEELKKFEIYTQNDYFWLSWIHDYERSALIISMYTLYLPKDVSNIVLSVHQTHCKKRSKKGVPRK